ncbi:MAG: sulfatase family protein [Planctomycetota bacterium]|jgi:N-sulfoglucosamine sulfohydrolase
MKSGMDTALAFGFSRLSYGHEKKGPKPNILLMVAEDHGLQLSCYGDKHISTPNLDALANKGVRFEHAYVTQAGCSPSRASILTGQYPHNNGQIGLATHGLRMYKNDKPNLITYLKDAGYRTGIIGKIHVNPESAFSFDFKAFPKSNFNKRTVKEFASSAGEFFRASDDPFLMWISFPDAHRPFHDQQEGIPDMVMGPDDVETLPMVGVSTRQTLQTTASYYNCMQRLDVGVGMVLQELADSAKANNTLIVYLSDHGPDFPRGKKTIREGGSRVPMIMSWKGHLPKGRVESRLVSSLDILPTILEIVGNKQHREKLDGRSLMPLFNDKPEKWREYLFTEFTLHWPETYFPGRAIRDRRFKLVHNLLPHRENPVYDIYLVAQRPKTFTPDELKNVPKQVQEAYKIFRQPPEFELYDLQNDPWEFHNLAEDTRYTEQLIHLKKRLAEWQEETNDPLRYTHILAKFTAENDATMTSGKYIRKKSGQWKYPKYFFEGNDM